MIFIKHFYMAHTGKMYFLMSLKIFGIGLFNIVLFTYFLSYNHKKGVFVNTLYVYIQNNFASSLQIQLKETFSLNMYSTFAVGKKTIDSPYEKLSIQIGKTSEDDIKHEIYISCFYTLLISFR